MLNWQQLQRLAMIPAAAHLAARAAIFARRYCLPGNGLNTFPIGK